MLLKPRALRHVLMAVMEGAPGPSGREVSPAGGSDVGGGGGAGGTASALSSALAGDANKGADEHADRTLAAGGIQDPGGIGAFVVTSAGDLLASSCSGPAAQRRERLLGALSVNVWSAHVRAQTSPFPGLKKQGGVASTSGGLSEETGTDAGEKSGDMRESSPRTSGEAGEALDEVDSGAGPEDSAAPDSVSESGEDSTEGGAAEDTNGEGGSADDGAEDNLQCLCVDNEEGKIALTAAGNFLIVVYGSGHANFGLLREKVRCFPFPPRVSYGVFFFFFLLLLLPSVRRSCSRIFFFFFCTRRWRCNNIFEFL
jgi:hypothetical protein